MAAGLSVSVLEVERSIGHGPVGVKRRD